MSLVPRLTTTASRISIARSSASSRLSSLSSQLSAPPQFQLRRAMASLPKTMKGVVIEKTGGTEVLQYKTDLPVPEPKEGEVLVKNEFIGVNYIDTYFRTGLYPAPSFPYILGREGSGTIAATGPNPPHSLAPGTRVAWMGASAYAEYTAVDAAFCIAIPDSISLRDAAAAILQGLTALTLIREAHYVSPGDWVLVHAAAGGVGLWLCQLLRAAGARTIATASTAEKRELARRHGAEVLLEYHGGEEPGAAEAFAKEVVRIADGKGVVAVFDGVGKATFDASLASLRSKGTMVSFGNASGPVPPVAIARLSPKNLRLMRPTLFSYLTTREEFEKYANELWDFMTKGKMDANVHDTYPLQDVARAHQDLEGRKTTGKLLLQP
ncbi:NAD(P)-binding protein [Glonium stellatum]|uniref:Probable quinone oxidoreductase n=1 Tax=Glonium stellatum TaxID=574774 RepID=A0A8E2FAY4_9PEZI|nr:NAD(P)-binding protein [Glonium stellatum]